MTKLLSPTLRTISVLPLLFVSVLKHGHSLTETGKLSFERQHLLDENTEHQATSFCREQLGFPEEFSLLTEDTTKPKLGMSIKQVSVLFHNYCSRFLETTVSL